MKVLQAYKSKKYLLRMLLSMTILMVAVLFFSFLAMQFNAERNAVRIQEEADRKVMNQIQLNVSFMTDVLKNLALSLYMDPNIGSLLSQNALDEMAVMRSMNTLKQAYLSSSFLHSILVYNGIDGRTYPVGELSVGKPDSAMTEGLVKLLRSEEKLPRMQLIPMNFSGNERSVDFFSLVIYQNFYAANTRNESALVVNVKPEWLFENLRAVSGFDQPDRSSTFIVDSAGSVLLSGIDRLAFSEGALRTALTGKTATGTFGSFSEKLGGSEELLVSYMGIKGTDWTVVSIQPYDIVLEDIQAMRNTSVMVIAGILLLSIALSVWVAHKLYRPVEMLIRRLGIRPEEEVSGRSSGADELSTVANVYSELMEKLHWASNEQDKQRHIVKNYYLRTLVTNSPSLTETEFANILERNEMNIAADRPYRLIIAKVDGYADFVRNSSYNQRTLYYFAIGNIAEEMLRREKIRCEIADMKSDHIVILVSDEANAPEEQPKELQRLLRGIQDVVKRYYKLSLSMTISNRADSYVDITERYDEAIQFAMYKLLFGHGAIIMPEMVRTHLEHYEYSFPVELEKRLVESIRTNRLDEMETAVDHILDHIRVYHYDHIVHGMLHVVDIVKSTVRDINNHRVTSLRVDLSTLSRDILEKETLEEVRSVFKAVCKDIHEKLNRLGDERNTALTDAVKEIIEMNYKDSNLSLQGIAAMLHKTPSYVGRIFKTTEFVSIGEYLNEVRLRHAQAYLETKNFSIKEIMELVGFVNESNFFKLFKKTFGVTPKEYRLKKKIGINS
ncbi:helix-turn-helix domain-containing protein [Paenibacillus sp.]|uniref:helix-turn-helix domain-containing protein n=1 Tax=Paenibacillus sp. TaxID=58172 RepID=UPI002D4F64FD|nr:helix-turn-helix domain-containing protein [Paenibacillus sp.]HZG56380.1 helix-turn-helix domain-containing protein [Paenibacillus sp.]